MITNDFRPQKFEDMAGQQLNKKIIKSIVKNPEKAPKSIILQGNYGLGKTTMARLFARALNCESDKSVEPCLNCEVCKSDIELSPFYREYDVAVTGSVDKIRSLRDTFFYSMGDGWKVIVLDEAHLASKSAQSALLKVIEEVPNHVFFVFCTTNVDKLLPTIRSRSLELRFKLVKKEDIIENLNEVLDVKGKEVSDDILELIALRSRGHMRNAHMYLDQYLMVGDENFRESVKSAKEEFLDFIYAMSIKDDNKAFKALDGLLTFPLADLQMDFQEVILDLTKVVVGQKDGNEKEKKIVDVMGIKVLKIVKQSMEDWVVNSFESDLSFQACMLSLYQLISSSVGKKKKGKKSRYERAKKK